MVHSRGAYSTFYSVYWLGPPLKGWKLSLHTHVLSKCMHTFTQIKKTDIGIPKSKLQQSHFRGESEQSGHPNYGVLHGILARSLRKVVIKTSGSRALWWSGTLHVLLIWRHEIANSWPLNGEYEVSRSLFLSLRPLILRGTLQRSFPAWEYWEPDHYTENLKRQV